jgi:GNAT superfamily N-acetyltransferase
MADTKSAAVVELGIDDVQGGFRLSTEARWNQNEADWRFFLERGHVFGVRDKGQLVATAALLPYSSGNAWISMVLVTAKLRRQGIAIKLLDRCLDMAAKLSLVPWLDATPEGAHVYGSLGFTSTAQLQRLRLENSPTATDSQSLLSCSLDQFVACDRAITGFDRSVLFSEFAKRAGTRIIAGDHAMALVRDGRTARHIGPLFAETAGHALSLVNALVRAENGPFLMDTIEPQEAFLTKLAGSGWKVERPLQRMRLGRVAAHAEKLPYAVAGPEFG